MQNYILRNANVCLENSVERKDIAISEGKIIAIENHIDEKKCNLPVIEFAQTDYILPGFIDLHIHGSSGVDTMDATVETFKIMSKALFNHGVTSYLPTTMAASYEDIEKTLLAINKYNENPEENAAKILGVHLEGSFISIEKKGAQNPLFIKNTPLEKLKEWQKISNNLVKKITIAPETENAMQIISYCKENNIIASAGHTNCSAKTMFEAIENGCSQATHLFNAMSGVDHRRAGVVTAALMSPKVTAELIVDGIHLDEDTVNFAYTTKGADNIILITDAISAQNVGEGEFSLGGLKVIVKDRQARLENGSLAGSVLQMNEAVENMVKFTNCSILDIVKMTSTNQAKALNVPKGAIKIGYDADFVVLDKNLQVKQVFN